MNEVIWDANYLLNENKGYVKQSDFTATWHVLSVFMPFPLNLSFQITFEPCHAKTDFAETDLFHMAQLRAFLNVKQFDQVVFKKYGLK